MAALMTLRRSTPAFSISFGDRVGDQAGDLLRRLAEGRAVRLHADRVDHGVRPAAVGEASQRLADVVLVGDVEHLDAVLARAHDPLGDEVDADDLARAAVLGDARAHVADRPEAEHGDRAAIRDVRVLDGLPGGGEDVREVDEAVVRRALGDLDRAVVRLRDAQAWPPGTWP